MFATLKHSISPLSNRSDKSKPFQKPPLKLSQKEKPVTFRGKPGLKSTQLKRAFLSTVSCYLRLQNNANCGKNLTPFKSMVCKLLKNYV